MSAFRNNHLDSNVVRYNHIYVYYYYFLLNSVVVFQGNNHIYIYIYMVTLLCTNTGINATG